MAKRTLRVVLDIEIQDLDDNERKMHYEDMCLEEMKEKLPSAKDFSAEDYGFQLSESFDYGSELTDMIFEGSDIFGTFGVVRLNSAEWIGEWDGKHPKGKY